MAQTSSLVGYAQNQSVLQGQRIPLSSLLYGYSGAVVGFDFKEIDNNGGYVVDNFGNRLTPGALYGGTGSGININLLSQYYFVTGGQVGSSDTITFNVDDKNGNYSAAVSAKITTTAPLKADLVVQNLNVPTTVSDGATLNVSYDVKNVGTATAAGSNSKVSLQTSSGAIVWSTVLTDQQLLANLSDPTHNVAIPIASNLAPGSYKVVVQADANNLYGETNSVTSQTVQVTAPPGPKITVTSPGHFITDEATVKPFSGVAIAGSTAFNTETLTIVLLDQNGNPTDANGSLSESGIFLTHPSAGTYILPSGSPGLVTSELNALVFTPKAHEVVPGQSVPTTFKIIDIEGSTQISDKTTTVMSTATNDPPTITGTTAGQATTDTSSIKPFAHTTVSSVDVGAQEALTITLLDGSGHATDANGLLSGAGVSWVGAGTYHVAAGTPTAVTSELDALLFTPSEEIGATKLQLSVAQGSAVSNVSTSVSVTASLHSLANDIDIATALLTAQVQDGRPNDLGQLPVYLDDKPLVVFLASDIATHLADPPGNYTISSGSMPGFINTAGLSDPNFINQCVALVQGLDKAVGTTGNVTNLNHGWTNGYQVDVGGGDNPKLSAGTPIATFVNAAGKSVTSMPSMTGNYAETSDPHAGIFLAYGNEQGHPGFFMLDQYGDQTKLNPQNQPAEVRFYAFDSTTGNAAEYYTIVPH